VNGLVSLYTSQFVRGETAASYRTAGRALDLLPPGSALAGPAHFAVGASAVSLGRPEEGLRHFASAANLGRVPSLSVGSDPDVHGMAFAAHAHWLLGHDDDALASCNGAVALSRVSGSPYNVAIALAYASLTHQLRGDPAALARVVGELDDLCGRYGFAYYREWGWVLDGWCRGGAAGVELAQRGIDSLTAAGSLARMPYWLSLLADLADRDGRPDDARATLDAAAAGARARDDLWWLPEVLRMRAAYDDRDGAVARLETAVRLAAGHGSVALVRRCRHELAALGVPGSHVGPTA